MALPITRAIQLSVFYPFCKKSRPGDRSYKKKSGIGVPSYRRIECLGTNYRNYLTFARVTIKIYQNTSFLSTNFLSRQSIAIQKSQESRVKLAPTRSYDHCDSKITRRIASKTRSYKELYLQNMSKWRKSLYAYIRV